MKWGSALSRRQGMDEAFAEAAEGVERALGGHRASLLVIFASPHHAGAFHRLASLAAERFPGALTVGCVGLGVIGGGREAEQGPAFSLTGATLPAVDLSGFHLDMTRLPAADAAPGAWHSVTGRGPGGRPSFLVLADPFTFDADALVAGLDRAWPGAVTVGGLASGGQGAGEHRLLLGTTVHRHGAVGVALAGNVAVDALVAQGCRPIGRPMLVTRCRGGWLLELDGRPPLEVLGELHRSLCERDRQLARHSLFLGLDLRSERVEFDSGELLVRNLVGADPESGTLAVGAELATMQAVQFVVRDAGTAEEDLRRALSRYRISAGGRRPGGALLFSCTGRGAGLFGRPDHDTGLFEELLGPVPLGGFFCNGEIGPVGGTTCLHGYTSAFALFREALPAVEGGAAA
ncbi:MAG TPA: FIST N-terminal domain-containing protein [Anaeromyxobacteraceae bacterium]|nr:FIST N-terminal domain-containing protein [Anaeromyxobacteraceae bacterium]